MSHGPRGTPPHIYQPAPVMSPPTEAHGDMMMLLPMDSLQSPEVSPPPSPTRTPAPRDPRRAAVLKQAAHQAAQQVPPQQLAGPKKVRFIESEGKGDPDHITYVKSHYYEEHEPGALAAFCSNPRCQRTDWQKRCHRCGRCDDCSRLIFCKGAEKMVTGVAIGRLHERMDHAIWLAFRQKDFDPLLALLDSGVSVNFCRSSKGETALMAAAYAGRMDVCQRLLEQGANPEAKTDDGMTAWTFASRFSHNAIASLIQDYITGKRTPLVEAAPVIEPDLPEPLLVSPTASVSMPEPAEEEEAPLAEGLVFRSHVDEMHPFGGHWDEEDGPSYSPTEAVLGLDQPDKKRPQDGERGSQPKRARTS